MYTVPLLPRRTVASLLAMCTGRTRRPGALPVISRTPRDRRRPGAAGVERAECGTLARQPFEERSGSPPFAVLAVEGRHTLVHVGQPHTVHVEHRPPPESREAVPGEVDHVDVGSAQRETLLEDLGAFVHERVDRALDD